MTVLVKLLRKIIQLVQLKYKGVKDCYKNIYVKLTHTFVDKLWIFCVITVYIYMCISGLVLGGPQYRPPQYREHTPFGLFFREYLTLIFTERNKRQ